MVQPLNEARAAATPSRKHAMRAVRFSGTTSILVLTL
jgi:hypothetical protein